MSYPIVIVIIIITAVVSYLIGLFDAKTTNKWFGAESKRNESAKAETEIKLDIRRLADIQINDQNELLVSYEKELGSSKYTISSLNKTKLTELIKILVTLSTNLVNKPITAPHKEAEKKEKLAIEQPIFQSALKKQAVKKPAVLDLVSLLNKQLDQLKDQIPFHLEIKENPDHSLIFLVNDKAFSTLDEIEPGEARSQFQRAIEAVSGDS